MAFAEDFTHPSDFIMVFPIGFIGATTPPIPGIVVTTFLTPDIIGFTPLMVAIDFGIPGKAIS